VTATWTATASPVTEDPTHFENLLSQIQRALAQLKNAAEKAYKATPPPDSPHVRQALTARVMDPGSPHASPDPRRETAWDDRPTSDRRRRPSGSQAAQDSDDDDDGRVCVEYHHDQPPEHL
jgi:hypothetical protein